MKVAATAIDDLSGNSYSGIDDTTTFNFTTGDGQAPTVLITGPSGLTAVNGAFTATATFSENVTGFVIGDISLLLMARQVILVVVAAFTHLWLHHQVGHLLPSLLLAV